MITFVTFHVNTSQTTADVIPNQHTAFSHGSIYEQMIALLFRSIALCHHQYHSVVLTDLQTQFHSLPKEIQIYRTDIDTHFIMLSRLKAQLDFLNHHDFLSDVIFLDSDMLVNANLEGVFQREFDVGLTNRELPEDMPINGAVICVSKRSKSKAIAFLQQVYDLYKMKYLDYGVWWGDQYALVDALDYHKLYRPGCDLISAGAFQVLLLPCEQYNYSPDVMNPSSIVFELSHKRIIHFKGKLKDLMYPYWVTYLEPKERKRFHNAFKAFQNRLILFVYSLIYMIKLDRFSLGNRVVKLLS